MLLATVFLFPAPALADAADTPGDIVVSARRLDAARDSILPAIGANQTVLDRAALDIQPGGADRPLNTVLLQTPGVTFDSDDGGEVHVRNEHGNIQYRLNGVVVPDTIRGFGPLVDTRVAQSVTVLTGALPAQYGERTAGVVQLIARSGDGKPAGDIGFTAGANGLFQPSATFRDSIGRLDLFVSGSYLRSDLGLAAPNATGPILHDRTEQERGFAWLSWLIDDGNRISMFGGTSIGHFEIPVTAGVAPSFTLNGRTTFDSATLDQVQKQQTHYGVLAFQHSAGGFDIQVAPFLLWARGHFLPDPAGGLLLFDGADTDLVQTNLAFGAQADASLALGASHTLRFGLYGQRERTVAASDNRVFAVDGAGDQASDVPIAIAVDRRAHATTLAAYVQDEWRLADGLTLNAGLRYDRYTAALVEDQLSPRIGLVWKATPTLTLHAGYARNFTPPPLAAIGIGDLPAFAGTTGAAEITTADPVRAEREHQFDAGAQLALRGGLTLGVDAYYKMKRNLLDDTQYGLTELLAPFNYASGDAWGVEFSASYSHGPLAAYANVARGAEKGKRIVSNQFLFDAADVDASQGQSLFTDHSQAWTVSAGASLRIANALGELQPAIDAIYGSGLRRTPEVPGALPNSGTQEAYVQVNLGVAQQLGHDKDHAWTVRLDVANLFDRRALVHDGSGIGGGQPQYLPRRAVTFGLRKAF